MEGVSTNEADGGWAKQLISHDDTLVLYMYITSTDITDIIFTLPLIRT